jgi:hypothetical protein
MRKKALTRTCKNGVLRESPSGCGTSPRCPTKYHPCPGGPYTFTYTYTYTWSVMGEGAGSTLGALAHSEVPTGLQTHGDTHTNTRTV